MVGLLQGNAGRQVLGACLGALLSGAPSALAQVRQAQPRVRLAGLSVGARRDPEPPARTERRPVRLLPMLPLASAAGWILRPDPAPSSREERAEEELERYFDDALSQDRLRGLGANPYYYDLMRAMRQGFQPDMRALERERRASMNPIQVLLDELGRYAQGPERPQDNRGLPPPSVANDHFDDATRAALEWQDQVNLLNAPVTWYRVDLRVTQNPEGVVAAAWVIHSSGYETLDAAALAAVRSGTVQLPPPPMRLVHKLDAIQSDWAFEAGDVATYWNAMGCVDDPVQGGSQCAAGGRGLTRTRIRLLRVYDAETPSFEERRFRSRQNPPRLRP